MKSTRIATIEDKACIQKKYFEVRKCENGQYELNMIWPTSYNFGFFETPVECVREAKKVCVLGVRVHHC